MPGPQEFGSIFLLGVSGAILGLLGIYGMGWSAMSLGRDDNPGSIFPSARLSNKKRQFLWIVFAVSVVLAMIGGAMMIIAFSLQDIAMRQRFR